MRRRLFTVAAVLVVLAAALLGQHQARFRRERPVIASGPGAQRLEVDATLLQDGQPFAVTAVESGRYVAAGGLGDLRFFAPDGREVPYLLVPPPVTPRVSVPARVSAIAATEETSGFEADFGEAHPLDGISFRFGAAPYLKRFRLEGSGDRERWTVLVAEGTAFDLPAERLTRTIVEFDRCDCRYVRVTWDDTNSARLPLPSLAQGRRAAEPRVTAAPPTISLPFERRASEPGHSRFAIRLPGPRFPIVALDLDVGGGHLLREARVVETSLADDRAVPSIIGRASLRRVVREGLVAAALRVPVRPPNEPLVELVVDDGDNPPLELEAVRAVLAELPWIYLDSAPPGLVARWGDPRLPLPRYDLEAARPEVAAAPPAGATWGPPTLVVAQEGDAPALPMPETGASIDVTGFRYARSVPVGAAGLIAVPLDAAVLAHSVATHPGFGDLRIVDPQGRQVPYLIERRDGPLTLALTLEPRDLPESLRGRARRTAYALALPYDVLPEGRLALTTRARVFRRQVDLAWLEPADAQRRDPLLRTFASHTWEHADENRPAPALIVRLAGRPANAELVVLVDEGDNQPLPLEPVTLLLPAYALRLFRPDGVPLTLVYGNRRMQPPRYDLALLAPHLFGRVAVEVEIGPEEDRGTSEAPPPTVVSRTAFWVTMGLAVVVLLGIVVRLMRNAGGVGDPAP